MLNDNVAAGSQILPFYLAGVSSDVALIRGQARQLAQPLLPSLNGMNIPIWLAACKLKPWP